MNNTTKASSGTGLAQASEKLDPFDPESYKSPAIMSQGKTREAASLKLLVFDMGHVFVDFDWSKVCQGFSQSTGASQDQLKQAMVHCAGLGYESGKIDTAGFLKELNNCLSSSISLEEFKKLWVATFHENQEMAELLSKLKTQRPIYLLSNTNEVHYEHLQASFNVARHFQELILSYKVGSSKPEREIYLEVLKRSGLEAGDCLFVDDLEPNIRAARELGIYAVQFEGAGKLKETLKDLGFQV